MDFKGISWVGNMCQRLEEMCVEVDETVYEDTVNYVGNQMRTVGDTVKKFCSEVMQDVLASSSLDPVKEDAIVTVSHHSDNANTEKPKVDNENVCVNTASEQMVKDPDDAAASNTVNYVSCDSVEEQCTTENSQSQCSDLVSSNRAIYGEKDLRSKQDSVHKSLSNISSINVSATKDSGEEFTYSEACCDCERDEPLCECRDVGSKGASVEVMSDSKEDVDGISGDVVQGHESQIVRSQTRVTSSEHVSTELGGSESSMMAAVDTTFTSVRTSVDVENCFPMPNTETSNPLFAHKINTSDAEKQQGILGNEQLSKLKLEESCVLVEKSDNFSRFTLEAAQKSYKKKLREVFSPGRWSKCKRDQEELAAWCEEQCRKNMVSTSMVRAEIQQPQIDSLESEWELL